MSIDLSKLEASLRLYQTAEHRIGMRSALADAAGICDQMANEITAKRRTTLMQREIAAALRAAGDAIWKAREAVEIPGNGGRIIAGLQDACAYARGEREPLPSGGITHAPDSPLLRSQDDFGRRYQRRTHMLDSGPPRDPAAEQGDMA